MNYREMSNRGGRDVNEDAVLCLEHEGSYCFVVGDGLGAHGGGDVASSLLVEAFSRAFYARDARQSAIGRLVGRGGNLGFLSGAFDQAQAGILLRQKGFAKMKTTGVALSIANGRYAWGHIGDSRLYHFRHNALLHRTLDHSVSQMLALSGAIRDEDIRGHPDRNKLLRVLGEKWDTPRYELSKEHRAAKGDAFLLCSDGFWEHIGDGAIAEQLSQGGNAKEWLSAMAGIVEKNGSDTAMDNYSAITVIL